MQSPFPSRPFTLRDTEAHGTSRRAIARAVENGTLIRVSRGVYIPADLPLTVPVRVAAIALVVSPTHVVIDRTAAWLHGVDALTWEEHDLVPPVETAALRFCNPTRRPEVDGRTRDLSPQDVMFLDGVRVTTPLRTALDLGCNLRRRDAMASMNALAREHGITQGQMFPQLSRYRGRRGVVQLRELVPLVDVRLESHRESWVWIAIHDAGLPMPEPQLWIHVDAVPTFRLDFAYPHSRVCVEYDGIDAHQRTTEQRQHDESRREWLRLNGWTVIVVRRGDFTGAGLDRWLSELQAALAPSYSNRRW